MNWATEQISRKLLLQRLRNRLLDALALWASFEQQLAYERRVPFADVPGEVFQTWLDHADEDLFRDLQASGLLYPEEYEAMSRFHTMLLSAYDAIGELPATVAEAQALTEWRDLSESAARTFSVCRAVGYVPEDEELP